MTGIIAATRIEVNLIMDRLRERTEESIQNKSFFKGSLQDKPFVICNCGIGKVNAAHGAALLIDRFKPDMIYIIGIGGAYPSSGLKIGDIIVAEKEIYGDEGLLTGDDFCPMDGLLKTAGILDSEFRFQNEFPMHMPDKLRGFGNRGNFITVSTCTGALSKGIEMEKRFNGVCENMEGAAVAQIAALNSLPVVELRGISNVIEDRAAGPLSRTDLILASETAQKFFLEMLTAL